MNYISSNSRKNIIWSQPKGSGKSLCAAFLACGQFTNQLPKKLFKHVPQTGEYLFKRIEDYNVRKKMAIITPSAMKSTLLYILENFTPFKIAYASAVQPQSVRKHSIWKTVLEQNHILVFEHKKFQEVLGMGYLKMEYFDLAIFTHCHLNTANLRNIMTDFYWFDWQLKHVRPKIFIIGLTEPMHFHEHGQALATILDADYYKSSRFQYEPVLPGVQVEYFFQSHVAPKLSQEEILMSKRRQIRTLLLNKMGLKQL